MFYNVYKLQYKRLTAISHKYISQPLCFFIKMAAKYANGAQYVLLLVQSHGDSCASIFRLIALVHKSDQPCH